VPVLWGQVEPLAHRPIRWLAAAALASIGLYLFLPLRYPLLPSLADPRASWVSQVGSSVPNLIQHLAVYLGLTLLYLAVLRLLAPSQAGAESLTRGGIALILAVWLACSGILLFAAPAGESHDVFDYLFRGRMMVEYRANPLAEVPDSFGLSIPYTRYLAWRKNVDTYGPLWEAASAAVAGIVHRLASWLGWWEGPYLVCPRSPESCRLLVVYLTGYRLLAVSLTGLSGWLIFSIVRWSQPAWAPLALAAWLWNPLVLIASALGGHNDALMLALLLLSWWFLQRQRPFWALLALILAAHVKLTALIWLPACLLWIAWRQGWRRALKLGLGSAACGLVVSRLLYQPFGGWGTLPRMLHERSAYFANSPWQILNYLLAKKWGWAAESARQLSTRLPNGLSAASALLVPLWMFNFRPSRWRVGPSFLGDADHRLWRVLGLVSLLFLLVGSFWFQHWYVLWCLAPAVLLPDRQLTRSVLPWLAFGALSSNVAVDFFLSAAPDRLLPAGGYILSVALIWTPALLSLVIGGFARQKKIRLRV
jgi:hypothetical protein